MQIRIYLFLAFFIGLCLPVMAEDISVFKSSITASQEQPKLLVIIPWKPPQDEETIDDGIAVEENFFLKPLNRPSFRRYTGHLHLLIDNAETPTP